MIGKIIDWLVDRVTAWAAWSQPKMPPISLREWDGVSIMSAEDIYGPGPFTGKSKIDTTRGTAVILSTDWSTVLAEPRQMAWVMFPGDPTTKLIMDGDDVLDVLPPSQDDAAAIKAAMEAAFQ